MKGFRVGSPDVVVVVAVVPRVSIGTHVRCWKDWTGTELMRVVDRYIHESGYARQQAEKKRKPDSCERLKDGFLPDL